jgi:hypothetical protein
MEKYLKNPSDSGKLETSPQQPGTFNSVILPSRTARGFGALSAGRRIVHCLSEYGMWPWNDPSQRSELRYVEG